MSKIDHNSRLYRAFHEAGHYVAALIADAEIQSLEVFPGGGGVCRVKHSGGADQRQIIATGGYAVEYLLYISGRLVNSEGVNLSQRDFINLSMDNAADDKKTFFDGDHSEDGLWAGEMDMEFMDFGIDIAQKISPLMSNIENIAIELEAKSMLTGAEAEHILTS